MTKKQRALEEIKEAIRTAEPNSAVYVGSDSQRYKKDGKYFARYATVVVIHKGSKHGGRLFHWIDEEVDYGSLKQRLLNEAGYAVDAVENIIDDVLEADMPIHVHLDFNKSSKFASNVAVKEACGWVLGATGIEAQIKPDAWAASYAADFAVRGKSH